MKPKPICDFCNRLCEYADIDSYYRGYSTVDLTFCCKAKQFTADLTECPLGFPVEPKPPGGLVLEDER